MMMGCNKCMKMGGTIMLLSGIAFLLKDLGTWDFWNISWYTVLFLMWGIGSWGMVNCPDCQKMRGLKK